MCCAGKELLQQVAAAIELLDGARGVADDLPSAAGAAAVQKRVAKSLRARTRIFESRNGEGIPSVTQRE
jgi:hypothetical protein